MQKSDVLKMFEVTFGAKVTSIGSSSISFPGPVAVPKLGWKNNKAV
jgi:hypothetical protein